MMNRRTPTAPAKRFDTIDSSALPNFLARGFATAAATIMPPIIASDDMDWAVAFL